MDDGQDAKRVAAPNVHTPRFYRFCFPGLGHHPDRVIVGLMKLRRGAEREPGVFLEDEALNREWWAVVGGYRDATARAIRGFDKA